MLPVDLARLILKKSKKQFSDSDIAAFNAAICYLPTDWSIQRKAWHLVNGNTVPVCKCCTAPAKFMSVDYWSWCSNQCMGSDPEIIAKKKQTNKQVWGVENPQALPQIQQKQKDTLVERYGVDNYARSSEFNSKVKHTSQEKYGVPNPAQSHVARVKISAAAQSRDYTSVIAKRQATNIVKYGAAASSNCHLSADAIDKLNDIDYLIHAHTVDKKSCQQIAQDLGCTPTPVLTRLANAGVAVARHSTSQIESEIVEFIQSKSSTSIVRNSRSIISPLELDIVLPEKKLAIEINGVFWHSELRGKDKRYHLNKTQLCEDAGYQLIHILDNEWASKQQIVKSRLCSKLGTTSRIYARQCSIQLVNPADKTVFLNNNHIQGTVGSSVNLGLRHNGALVALMTFGKARYSRTEWELLRYCSAINTTVVGGASKLFAHFVAQYQPTSVVSYADRRWSTGDLYRSIGFEFSHAADPNYFYFNNADPSKLMSRVKFQKHKLSEYFEVDAGLSEWDNMKHNNYNRIWDCGNLVYTWTRG